MTQFQITEGWTKRTARISFYEINNSYLVAEIEESDISGAGTFFVSRSYDVLAAAVHLSLTGEIQDVDLAEIGEGHTLQQAAEKFEEIEAWGDLANLTRWAWEELGSYRAGQIAAGNTLMRLKSVNERFHAQWDKLLSSYGDPAEHGFDRGEVEEYMHEIANSEHGVA